MTENPAAATATSYELAARYVAKPNAFTMFTNIMLSMDRGDVQRQLSAEYAKHSERTCQAVQYYSFGVSDTMRQYSASRVALTLYRMINTFEPYPSLIGPHEIIAATAAFQLLIDKLSA